MVLLSFDIEEFDLPFEYNQAIDMSEQIRISEQGLERILQVLEQEGVRATFYSTVVFMERLRGGIRERLLSAGHEIASHGISHSSFSPADYTTSRRRLQELTGQRISGFRMARMQPIDHEAQRDAGYTYDSSLHPTYLPGRYNHWDKPRKPYQEPNGLWTLPASVVPGIRFPLFWLSMHNLPEWLYLRLMSFTAKRDHYLNTYYHPWEFADLKALPYQLPFYIVRNSGEALQGRLLRLIRHLKAQGLIFGTTQEYLSSRQ
ncbi:MAG: polysaccharide deacetylase family protein [Porphyromonadaceae bacterium]|nr:polysaccharide deacetylase family protein [Porphyromonadaceae bacterium]